MPHRLVEFRARLVETYGAGLAEAVWQSMGRAKRQAYWLNPLIARPEGFQPLGVAVSALDGVYSIAPSKRELITRHAGARRGWIYPVSPSSLLAVVVLAPRLGEEILDLAAAPGGKTAAIAARMQNSGRIAAVEVVRARFHRLRANLARCGVTNTRLYLSDGRGIGRKVPERFDRVLLDAPCSSEARIRLDEPRSYAHWKPRKIKEASRKQAALLRSAYRALKPGGVLVYCTCSFAPEENEQVVGRLLNSEPGASLDVLKLPGVPCCEGLMRWRGREFDDRMRLAVRVLPDDLWDGFFVCRIRKADAAGIQHDA